MVISGSGGRAWGGSGGDFCQHDRRSSRSLHFSSLHSVSFLNKFLFSSLAAVFACTCRVLKTMQLLMSLLTYLLMKGRLVMPIGTIAAVKLVGIAASSYVAWTSYRTMPEPIIRRKLRKLFEDGQLCHVTKKKRGKQMIEVKKYPTIQRVTIHHDHVEAVFTLPHGLNPADVESRDWHFRQVFGEHVELDGNVRAFVMWVYKEDVKKFAYDLEAARKATEGMALPIYAGRSRTGEIAYDMAQHPHLLIAGLTGSGKSVSMRSILTTLVELAGDRLELYCADLKRSEFHLFRGVAKRVDVELEDLHGTLLRIQKELDVRGRLLDSKEVMAITELPEAERPPFIVVAIDEVALLKEQKEIMAILERVGQIGRSLGIFLILAMQRPDAKLLDGSLKVNLSVRMAFRHPDEINSRITIGSGEAAKIKPSQKGRMVFGLDRLMFVQAPLLEPDDAKKMLERHKAVTAPPKKGGHTRKPKTADKIAEDYEEALEELRKDGEDTEIEFGIV